MQLCSIDLVQMKLIYTEKEPGKYFVDNLTEFYRKLTQDGLWLPLEYILPSGTVEAIFMIEKKYEQKVKDFLKKAAAEEGLELEFVEAPEKMAVENNRKLYPLLTGAMR